MDVPLLIWLEVPLLIWLVGGKINSRIRLTSAKVEVEVEAELGKIFDIVQNSDDPQPLFWSLILKL